MDTEIGPIRQQLAMLYDSYVTAERRFGQALRRHLLIPPARRGHAELALEGAVECGFRVVANGGGYLADGLLPLRQKLLCQQHARLGEILHGGCSHGRRESLHEGAARQARLGRQISHRPAMGQAVVQGGKGAAHILVFQPMQPVLLVHLLGFGIGPHRFNEQQLRQPRDDRR